MIKLKNLRYISFSKATESFDFLSKNQDIEKIFVLDSNNLVVVAAVILLSVDNLCLNASVVALIVVALVVISFKVILNVVAFKVVELL